MTTDGRDVSPDDGAAEGEDAGIPPELRGLHDELRDLRFGPRPGLEDEVLARLSDDGETRRSDVAAAPPVRRRAVRAAAVLTLIAAIGGLARMAADRGDAPLIPVTAPADDRSDDGGFALRWGRDARVLAAGTDVEATGPGAGGIRCGRVGRRLGCRGTGSGSARFASARGPAVLRDFCCLDYDGGGPADDGVRVVAGQAEAVVSFWVYEDLDGTGSFTDGDLLRTVVDGEGSSREALAAGRVRQVDRCCTDLDGGPHRDDGLFVLATDGEHVALAVLYEDATADGRLGPGDRLRALRTTPPGGDPGRGTR